VVLRSAIPGGGRWQEHWRYTRFWGLTRAFYPVRVNSWVLIHPDSIPIGDCDSRILELKLQFGRNCREGISAYSCARNYLTGFVRLHVRRPRFHREQYSNTTFPSPVSFSSLGAPGGIRIMPVTRFFAGTGSFRSLTSQGAVGFVLLSAVSLALALRPSGV
jgi:hypothetical protein